MYASLVFQTVKNLVYIGRILFSLSHKDSVASDQLEKLFDQMNKLCRFESGHFPKESHKRSSVFKWIAAISTVIGRKHLEAWLVKLLPPLHKEMKNDNKIGGIIIKIFLCKNLLLLVADKILLGDPE